MKNLLSLLKMDSYAPTLGTANNSPLLMLKAPQLPGKTPHSSSA